MAKGKKVAAMAAAVKSASKKKTKVDELLDEDDVKGAEASASDDEAEGSAAEPAADDESTGGIAEEDIPAVKEVKADEIKKWSMEQLNAFVDYHSLPVQPWLGETLAAKRKALIKHLNLGPKAHPALNDPLAKAANEIENLDGQAEIEGRIDQLLATEGMNDFVLGGLLQKLSDVGEFGDQRSFRDHVEARFEKLKYRKARYLIQIYVGLTQANIGWGEVSEVGWTKLIELLPVLTADNVTEWVEKAKAMTVPSLREAVKAALKSEQTGEAVNDDSPVLKTKSFKLYEQQVEVVEDALNKAMEDGQTTVPSAALEYICLDYLSSSGKKGVPSDQSQAIQRMQKKLTRAEQKVAALEAQMEASGEANEAANAFDFAELFKAWLKSNEGDVVQSVTKVLGAIDEVFPTVDLTINSLTGDEEAA